jgi:hypothetical protein
MLMKDQIVLRNWLRSGATLAEVESVSRFGLVDNERFTEQARRAYKLLWTWSASRFAGVAGLKQERAYARLGSDGLRRRFERCNRIIARLSA